MIGLVIIAAWLIARSWQQQERLNAARAEIIESDKVRALAEAELNRQRDLAEQNMRFTAAVENMTQGLCMIDGDARLVVCNERYAKMYRLPPELLKPGTLASRHHRPPCPQWPLEGRSRQRRRAAAACPLCRPCPQGKDRAGSTNMPTAS